MRRIILCLVIAVAMGTTLSAQQYVPMPTDSAQWRQRGYVGGPGFTEIYDYELFFNGRDTLIKGNTYHQVIQRVCHRGYSHRNWIPDQSCTATYEIFLGGIREVNKKVYIFLYKDTLFFDFGVNVGDSINLGRITGIDSILIGGKYRRRFLTSNYYDSYYIEGVGSKDGFMHPSLYDQDSLYCFTDLRSNSSATFQPYPDRACTEVYPVGYTGVNNLTAQKNEITVYPNPSAGDVSISSFTEGTFYLYNLLGQVQSRYVLQAGKTQIRFPDGLAAGIYIGRFESPAGFSSTLKLIYKP